MVSRSWGWPVRIQKGNVSKKLKTCDFVLATPLFCFSKSIWNLNIVQTTNSPLITFIKSVSSVWLRRRRLGSRGRSIAPREVIPQVRPPTPPPCLLLISGHRGGTFELVVFVLADNTPPLLLPLRPSGRAPLAAGHDACAARICYANHKLLLFDVAGIGDIDLCSMISLRRKEVQ